MTKGNPAAVSAHLEALQRDLARQAFWKTALFGTILLERQWPVYARASIGRTWGAPREVRKVLDRFWQAVPTGVRISDKYLLSLEEHPVEPVAEPWDRAAAAAVAGCIRLLEVFREKNKQAAGRLAEENLHSLAGFLSACGEAYAPEHPLVRSELDFQRSLCQRLCAVPNAEKPAFTAALRAEDFGSLVGERWFPDYPVYKPLKRRSKPAAELRYTSTRYDALLSEERASSGWESRQRRIQARAQLLEARVWPPRADGTPGRAMSASDVVRTYDVLQWEYSTGAKECLLATGDGALAKVLYGLAAQSCEALLELIDKGWPTEKRGTDGFGRDLLTPAWCAYLAHNIPLALRLLRRSWTSEYQGPNCQMLRKPQTGWLDREEICVFFALLQGDCAGAQRLLEDARESWAEPYRLLLAGDGAGVHRWVVKNIRALRGHFEYQAYRPTVAFESLVLLKLARQLGVAVEVPHVVELPPALLEDAPPDAAGWPLAGQALLREALGPQGDRLLAQCRRNEQEKTRSQS